eukprot:TRINITY_DN5414_c0_g3_i2.p2 TRINITY_DN5414_c0_g3~~TRINITY_DN5414_c0_g3_i2.p2  ORF type:complete len:104 (-),score=28.77 TRINITY_DN5414_c0_g3_i2:240-551(-)
MSLLAASRRVAQRSSAAQLVARRCLGDGVRGPPLNDLGANMTLAKEFFSKAHGDIWCRGCFSSSAPPLFLSSKTEYETDVPDVVQQLITTRRVKGQGGDEEEH